MHLISTKKKKNQQQQKNTFCASSSHALNTITSMDINKVLLPWQAKQQLMFEMVS